MTHFASEGISFSEPTEIDVAYLAGLLDGEGHFKTGPRFKAAGRNRGLPGLQITMTDLGAIEWCHATFGGKFYRHGTSATGRMVYGWSAHRQEDLRYLLPRLLPHLRVKALQAWTLLGVVEALRAQPRYLEPSSKLRRGSSVKNYAERTRRRECRLRWRAEVAQAQGALLDARRVLKSRNPPTHEEAPHHV